MNHREAGHLWNDDGESRPPMHYSEMRPASRHLTWVAYYWHFRVDPGVGTDRPALVACAAGSYWVAPDNGLLTGVLAAAETAEVRRIDVHSVANSANH